MGTRYVKAAAAAAEAGGILLAHVVDGGDKAVE